MNYLIAPSVLAANYRNLQADFDMVNQSEADWFHVDIMDGRFVPNISFGMFIVDFMKNRKSTSRNFGKQALTSSLCIMRLARTCTARFNKSKKPEPKLAWR
jgi:hypothetical protein